MKFRELKVPETGKLEVPGTLELEVPGTWELRNLGTHSRVYQKSTGVDGISAHMLKLSAPYITHNHRNL